MVYCSKCGTLNPDTSVICSNCGAPLSPPESRPYSRYERRRYYEDQYGYRHRGNGFGLLIAGLFVLILGLAALFGSLSLFWQYFWPVVLILIGVWLLIWGLRRNRRYSQAPPQ
ncbi:MAG: zinc-ribbon domain-containing protein [Chloroflexi bacterium]|nr:zinc-ribbon domain-containing protein [Chloroflexota bacterium]MCL5949538.1 zinc-ribbon domain-containing protein [Candidatus Bathyarchaeota archaeon]